MAPEPVSPAHNQRTAYKGIMVRAQCFVISSRLAPALPSQQRSTTSAAETCSTVRNHLISTGHAHGSLGDDEAQYRDGRGRCGFPGSIFESHSKSISPAIKELLHVPKRKHFDFSPLSKLCGCMKTSCAPLLPLRCIHNWMRSPAVAKLWWLQLLKMLLQHPEDNTAR